VRKLSSLTSKPSSASSSVFTLSKFSSTSDLSLSKLSSTSDLSSVRSIISMLVSSPPTTMTSLPFAVGISCDISSVSMVFFAPSGNLSLMSSCATFVSCLANSSQSSIGSPVFSSASFVLFNLFPSISIVVSSRMTFSFSFL